MWWGFFQKLVGKYPISCFFFKFRLYTLLWTAVHTKANKQSQTNTLCKFPWISFRHLQSNGFIFPTLGICVPCWHTTGAPKGKWDPEFRCLNSDNFAPSTCVTFFTERVKSTFRNKTWNKLWLQSFKWALLNWKTNGQISQAHLFECTCEITALEQTQRKISWPTELCTEQQRGTAILFQLIAQIHLCAPNLKSKNRCTNVILSN